MKRFRIDGEINIPEVKIHCDFTEVDNEINVECALEDHFIECDEVSVIEREFDDRGTRIFGFLRDTDRNYDTDLYNKFIYGSKHDINKSNFEGSLVSEFKNTVNKLYGIPTFYVKKKIKSSSSSENSALDVFKDVSVSRSSIGGKIYFPEVKIHCYFTEVDNKIRVECTLEDHFVEWEDEYSSIDIERRMYEFEGYELDMLGSHIYQDVDRNYETFYLSDGFTYDSKRDPGESNLEESLLSEFKTMVKKLYHIPTFYVKENIKSSNGYMESVHVTVSRSKKRKSKDIKRYEKRVIENRKRQATQFGRSHERDEEMFRRWEELENRREYTQEREAKNETIQITSEGKTEPVLTGTTVLDGVHQNETEKAILIAFEGRDLWVAKSNIHSSYDSKTTDSQKFEIDNWILKRNGLI